MPISEECRRIATKLEGLRLEKQSWQAYLKSGVGSEAKADIMEEIRRLNVEIRQTEQRLDECLGTQPTDPKSPPSPITCTFPSTATITTNVPGVGGGPFTPIVTVGLTFSGANHSTVSLSVSTFTISVLVGLSCTDTLTVTQSGTATGIHDPVSGHIDIPITFGVTHAVGGPFWCQLAAQAGTSGFELIYRLSSLSGILTTHPVSSSITGAILPAAPFDKSTGTITLVSNLIGGGLAGSLANMILPGTLICNSQF